MAAVSEIDLRVDQGNWIWEKVCFWIRCYGMEM